MDKKLIYFGFYSNKIYDIPNGFDLEIGFIDDDEIEKQIAEYLDTEDRCGQFFVFNNSKVEIYNGYGEYTTNDDVHKPEKYIFENDVTKKYRNNVISEKRMLFAAKHYNIETNEFLFNIIDFIKNKSRYFFYNSFGSNCYCFFKSRFIVLNNEVLFIRDEYERIL